MTVNHTVFTCVFRYIQTTMNHILSTIRNFEIDSLKVIQDNRSQIRENKPRSLIQYFWRAGLIITLVTYSVNYIIILMINKYLHKANQGHPDFSQSQSNQFHEISQLNVQLRKSADLLSNNKFSTYLYQIMLQVFKKVELYLADNDKELARELILVLSNWAKQYKLSKQAYAILYLAKSVYDKNQNIEAALKNLKLAEALVKQSNDLYLQCKIRLLEADIQFLINPEISCKKYFQCIKICQKYFLQGLSEEDAHSSFNLILSVANYKIALISKASNNKNEIIFYLKNSLRYAALVFGITHPLCKQIQKRLVKQKEIQNGKNAKLQHKELIYKDKASIQYNQLSNQPAYIEIYYDYLEKALSVSLMDLQASKKQKYFMEITIQRLDKNGIKCLRQDLSWISFKDRKIEIDESILMNLIKTTSRTTSPKKIVNMHTNLIRDSNTSEESDQVDQQMPPILRH